MAFIALTLIFVLVPVRFEHYTLPGETTRGYPRFTSHRYTIADDYPGLFVLALIPPAILVLGAFAMRRFRAYDLSMMSAILAMVPWSPAWPLGLGIGIWALVVLRRKEVQAAFAITANPNSRMAQWVTPLPIPQKNCTPVELPDQPNDAPAGGGIGSFLRSVRNCWFTSAPADPPPYQRPE
jgi:hypothetical protein